MDVISSFFGLLILSPVFIVILAVLMPQTGGKPFFFQERPGKHQRRFRIIKFKSMNDKRDKNGQLLPDVQRITPFGAFLRKSSLDEIPQLINVFIGDMSLVGPRPLLFRYIPLYSEEQLRRHEVRPGITGLAQVSGRNSISWTDKFALDVRYVDSMSLFLDIKIIFSTFGKVFKGSGVNQSDARPMEPFNGNN